MEVIYMKKIALAALLATMVTLAFASQKWVEVAKSEKGLTASVDANSVGRMNDGRVVYWLKSKPPVPREGLAYATYLYAGNCRSRMLETQARRAHNSSGEILTSGAEPGTYAPDEGSALDTALTWACSNAPAKRNG
jgi:hypothetical protein